MAILGNLKTNVEGEKRVMFFCPGCECGHQVIVAGDNSKVPVWGFNNNYEKPSFTPSILVHYKKYAKNEDGNTFDYTKTTDEICHSFVTDGKIQFLNDCTHKLKGQTVDLPDMDL